MMKRFTSGACKSELELLYITVHLSTIQNRELGLITIDVDMWVMIIENIYIA